MTSKTGAAGTADYTYDTVGNLLSVDLLSVDPPGGNNTIEYSIDVLCNRIAPLAEVDPATGAVLRRYVYGTHTNVPDYMVDYSGASPEVYAFVHDHRGSVRRVMNVATGAVAQAIDYDESGRVISDTNPGFQPFGFAGGLYDAATGLTRFGLRDYDPIPGRWTAMDPIGFTGGMNLYGYVIGDVINIIDIFGTDGWNVAAGLGPYGGASGGWHHDPYSSSNPGTAEQKEFWGNMAGVAAIATIVAADALTVFTSEGLVGEIGAKAFTNAEWAELPEAFSSWTNYEKGLYLIEQQGWLRALIPNAAAYSPTGIRLMVQTGFTPWANRMLAYSGSAIAAYLYNLWKSGEQGDGGETPKNGKWSR